MAQDDDGPERDFFLQKAVATSRFNRRCLFTRVVPVGLAIALFFSVAAGIGGMQLVRTRLQRIARLDLPKKQCASYPWLVYQELVYNNLGNVGPDSGNGEGMVIRARDRGGNDPARLGKNTFLVLNSTDDKYKAANATMNGLQGRFGAFNMPGSSQLNFKLSFRNENGQHLTMKRFALTLFDLDADVGLQFAESVAIGGYDEYLTTAETEIQIKKLSDGLTEFAASKVGTGDDNPLNPMSMTSLQKNRAVSLTFDNVTEIFGSVKTKGGRGTGFRVFKFVSKNSLACARNVAKIPGMPLQDLNCRPPLENPVALPADAVFDSWAVTVGDRVRKGDPIALILDGNIVRSVKSDQAGTVIAQQPLIFGDVIGEKLIELSAAVVKLIKLPPLRTSEQTSKAAICSADNRIFKKYHVVVGDNVKKGDKLATTTLVDGSSEEDILAPKGGGVAALQPLKEGDPCQVVEDMNLVTLGKFAPLSASVGETPAQVLSGSIFGKWLVGVGDAIKEGQPIAVIITSAGTFQKKSACNGTVVERQLLLPGSALDEVLPDERLVLVRSDGRLRPLDTGEGEESIKVPKAAFLVASTMHVGHRVKAGETIATISDMAGLNIDATAPRSGIITATVRGLHPTYNLDDAMSSDVLATIGGKLRPLSVRAMERASYVPEDNMIFKKWLKPVGQTVRAGETICVLQDKRGNMVNISAEVHGVIVAVQLLKPNDVIDDLVDLSPSMGAQVLAVVGLKLRRMQVGDGDSACDGASSWKDGMIFKEWKSKLGDKVTKGQAIATLDNNGTEVTVSAPRSGVITDVQEVLTEGKELTKYPGTIATIADKLRPLKVLYGEKGHDAEEGDVFDIFLVKVGERVRYGHSLARVTTKEGKTKEVICKRAGFVVALQDPLETGMKIGEAMYDQNLAVTGMNLRSLEVRHNEEGIKCSHGSIFVGWVKKAGDQVEEGDNIVKVENANGIVEDVVAPRSGVITDYQKDLVHGMKISDVMKDRNLAVIADKVGPLDTVSGEDVVRAPSGCTFKKWSVNVGDRIKKRGPVATLETKDGEGIVVQASRTGVVKLRQEGLQQGDDIDKRCLDGSLIVIGKLPALNWNEGMAPVMAPEGYFLEWKVDVGDQVTEGDPIAVVKYKDGETEVKKAPKSGTVHSKQEQLTPGSDLAEMLEDGDICVIGRFTEMKPAWTGRAVDAPPEAIFKKWHTKKGQEVEAGDLIATVAIPSIRRLEVDHIQGRRLQTDWVTQEIKAPTWGTVTDEQPLLPGMTVGEQQFGSSIATIDFSTPRKLLLCILAILCCCLCCLFRIMNKPSPVKEEPVKEEPCQELEGAGLDFDDGEKIIRILPKYRPLGIKHDHEAPIIVKQFTVNSYAKSELGIQKDWKLVAINGEQLHDSTDFVWVSNKLGDYMKDFELWPLALEFKAKGYEAILAQFHSRPIGVEFENRSPIKVAAVAQGTPAEENGIKPGMLLTKIGQEDVSGKRSHSEVMSLFKEALLSLDTADGLQRAISGQFHCFDGPGGHTTR